MIFIANPRGKPRKRKKTKKAKRGLAGRRRAASKNKSRHGGSPMKRRKKRRKVRARRKNPRRKRRVVRRRRVKSRKRRSNPRRRKRRVVRRRRVKSRRRKNPRRRRRTRGRKRRVVRRRRRRNPVRRKRRYARKRRVTRRRRRRNPSMKFLPSKSYFKTVLGDAAGITVGYLANAGIEIALLGSATRKGLLSGVMSKITNPHMKFAAQQTLCVLSAFVVGTLVKKFGGAKVGRLGENMTIGGLVRVLRSTIFYVSGVAGFSLGTELLAGGGGRMGGYMQQGNVDALETQRMSGYLVEGGEMGAYDRDYSYDYSMGGA